LVWKFLTNVKRIQDSDAINEAVMEIPVIATGRQQLLLQQIQQQTVQVKTLKTFDASGILRMHRIMQWASVLPQLRSQEALTAVPQFLQLSTEEQTLAKRTKFGRYLATLEEPKRYTELQPEKRLAEIERLKLNKSMILKVELLVLALLERLLWTTRMLAVLQVLQQLIEMSEAKRLYITPISGLESLQKLMLTIYVPYYMETPQRHNMLGIMLSMMTMQALAGRQVSVYASMSAQGQAIKQNPLLLSCEQREARQKVLALRKKQLEWFNTVLGLVESPSLTMKDNVPLFPDWHGKPIVTVTIFQALGFRYLISDNFSKHIGFPENKWYLVYPRIEVIVTRRGLKLHKRLTIPEWYYTTFRRDDYLRDMRRWRSSHG